MRVMLYDMAQRYEFVTDKTRSIHFYQVGTSIWDMWSEFREWKDIQNPSMKFMTQRIFALIQSFKRSCFENSSEFGWCAVFTFLHPHFRRVSRVWKTFIFSPKAETRNILHSRAWNSRAFVGCCDFWSLLQILTASRFPVSWTGIKHSISFPWFNLKIRGQEQWKFKLIITPTRIENISGKKETPETTIRFRFFRLFSETRNKRGSWWPMSDGMNRANDEKTGAYSWCPMIEKRAAHNFPVWWKWKVRNFYKRTFRRQWIG